MLMLLVGKSHLAIHSSGVHYTQEWKGCVIEYTHFNLITEHRFSCLSAVCENAQWSTSLLTLDVVRCATVANVVDIKCKLIVVLSCITGIYAQVAIVWGG